MYDSIINVLRRIRIRHRLLISFLLLSLIPAVFVGLYASSIYSDAMDSKLKQSAIQSTYLLNNSFTTELEKFQSYLDLISTTNMIQTALLASMEETYIIDVDSVKAVSDSVRMIPFSSTYLKNTRVVDRYGRIIYDLGYDDISKERFAEVLQMIDATAGSDSLQYIRTFRSYDKIVLGRKIYKFGNMNEPLGYILAYIDENFVSDMLLTKVSFGEGSNVMLLSANGQIISSQDSTLLGLSYGDNEMFSRICADTQTASDHMAAFTTDSQEVMIALYNPKLNSYLLITIPSEYFTEEISRINRSLLLICVLLIGCCLLFTTMVYSSIMKPINRMVSLCSITTDADLDKRIGDSSHDELGFLAGTIDKMFGEIKEFNIQYAEDQRQKRELELKMLQYQINPHFLFNTLNSLRFVTQMNDVPVLEDGIASLSSLLRHSLVKRRELIPISAEIENLRNYFTLQNIRYAGMFEVEYHLDEETLSCEIPRFTLQPLAENAIIHGTADGKCITITVSSRFVGTDVEVVLEDDGCGFDPASIAGKEHERFSGIGLSNVDQRVQLHYGKAYGLHIVASPGNGTRCLLRLPKKMTEENG